MFVLSALLLAYGIVGAVFTVAGYRQHASTLKAVYQSLCHTRGRRMAFAVVAAGACASVLTWPRNLTQLQPAPRPKARHR